jgi:tetratricopeptide (TPR) repeat protein
VKKSSILILVLFACAETPAAQSPEQLMKQGDVLYQQAKFAEAGAMYEKVLNEGYVSASLYYNLGNACYKSGDIPGAILNYERAQRLNPADEDLQHNLQLANLMITDRIEPTPRLFVWDMWDGIKGSFSLRGITLTMYALYVLVIVAAAALLLVHTYALRKAALISGSVILCVFLFSLAVFFARVNDVTRKDDAIVRAPVVNVKNSPDEKSSDAFVLHGGVKVRIIDRLGTWSKIRLMDGKQGWMPGSAFEVI